MKPLPLAIILLLLAGPLMASTIYVDASNTTGPWNGTADQPYQYIQDGINAATDGDTVLVRDGTYTGPGNRDLDFDGKAITVRSENGAEATTIDCENSDGGFGFSADEGADSVVDGFTIRNAHATYHGGGVYCYESSPTITNCRIIGNTASWHGGGIYCRRSNPTISNCVISGNTAIKRGGGIYCYEDSDPTIANCTIIGNSANEEGGGICCYDDSDPTITNCTITGNSATHGGGIYCFDYSNPTITNCTISANAAPKGGGICCVRNSNPTISKCILWGDSWQEIYVRDSDPLTLTYCTIEGGTGHSRLGTGCIQADPKFRSPLSGDFHLLAVSPCIDACPDGPADDIDREARPFPTDGAYDIGADEFVETDGDGMPDWWELKYFGSATAADPGGDEDSDGLTNLDEYGNVTDPVAADTDGDGLEDGAEVNTYGTDPLDTDTDDDGLSDSEEVNTYATEPTDPDTDGDGRLDGWEIAWGSDPLDPNSPGPVTVYVSAAEGDDTFNGKYPAHQGGLDGPKATIQAGIDGAIGGDEVAVADGTYAGEGNRDLDFQAKAITVRSENGASTTTIDCQGTEAEPHRGFWFGPYDVEGQVLDGFAICNGHADFGGSIFCDQYSKPTIKNCVITGNAAVGGGGIYCEYDSSPAITSCMVTGNTANGEGGGLDCWFSDATIVNCVITGNTAEWGGGICLGGGSETIVNCTITQNAADHAGGIYCYASEPTVTNCILWDNSPEEIVADSATPSVMFCDVEGGWPGQRNINADPRFADPASGNFHIQGDSPCFDMATWGNAPPDDIEGNPRPYAWGHDIGAYEFVGTDADDDGLPDEWEEHYFGHTDYGADDDPDGDGLTNWDEGAVHANPDDADTDGDGLNDGDEVLLYGSDPLDADTDDDGMLDGWEAEHALDPTDPTDALRDADGDLLLNSEEYLFGSDPQDANSPAFIYVDDDNAGDPAQDGSFEHPYESIQAAIDSATPPAVVKVLAGTYDEKPVMASDVWVIASGAATTTIAPSVSGIVVSFDGVANGLLAGLTVTSDPTSVLLRSKNSTLKVRNCVLTGANNGFGIAETGSVEIVNCLLADNAGYGIWAGFTASVKVTNCTFANNATTGAYFCGSAPVVITNSIFWSNGDDIYVGGSTPATGSYCDIGDGDFAGSNGNISADPLFIAGPRHDYYLSQLATGQAADSPCVDMGSDTAAMLGMDRLTTRTDGIRDTGIVDMGYHAAYPLRIDWMFQSGDIIIIHWNAQPGLSYTVEWSADRETWYQLYIGPFDLWADGDTASYTQKYYRVREQ